MVTDLLQLKILRDDGTRGSAWVDVSGPVIIEDDDSRSRGGCSWLRTQVGKLCVSVEPRELSKIIREHRGVR